MAWLRVGDSIATHPLMSRLIEACGYKHELKNEAFGLFISLASVSAGHLTDYVVEPGLVGQFAPGREKTLMDVLRAAGLVENLKVMDPVADKGETIERVRWLYKLTNDAEFVHMRTKKEVEIDRNRAKDRRNPELIIPVRVRDGDECRWCGKTVNFADRKSSRGGTIDSLTGHEESTVDTLVVACHGCNSERQSQTEGKWQLRPAPSRTEVYYTDSTIKWINNHDWSKANGVHIEDRQTRLDLEEKRTATQEAPSTAARQDTAVSSQAAVEQQEAQERLDEPRRGGGAPSTAADPREAGAPAAPAAGRTPTAPDQGKDIVEPEWLTQPIAANRKEQDETEEAQERLDEPRRGGGAPSTAADPREAGAPAAPAAGPVTECNETIKPNQDQNQITGSQGDDHRLSGSGRVGSGRDSSGRGRNTRRKRRGRRGGQRR